MKSKALLSAVLSCALLFAFALDEADADTTGLWVGAAVLNSVSYVNDPDPNQPVGSPIALTLIFHVDDSGNVRLLKEVIQMWQDGTYNPDGTVATGGHYVLLTDHALVPDYKGVALRDGNSVGRRISSVGFDFTGQIVNCTGSLSAGGAVTCGFTLTRDNPTNPFLHRYNPRHDNLDSGWQEITDPMYYESYDIDRQIVISIPASAPGGEPGWGESALGGSYTETIDGLYKGTITVKGEFSLGRVSKRGRLNE